MHGKLELLPVVGGRIMRIRRRRRRRGRRRKPSAVTITTTATDLGGGDPLVFRLGSWISTAETTSSATDILRSLWIDLFNPPILLLGHISLYSTICNIVNKNTIVLYKYWNTYINTYIQCLCMYMQVMVEGERWDPIKNEQTKTYFPVFLPLLRD